jgi:DNA-binding transcriptional regulator YdaS (Cro superfamily)
MTKGMSPNHAALKRAIAEAETQAGLAKAIGTSQALVGYWLRKSRRGVPAEWVAKIEQATGVPRHELRPDLFSAPSRETAA